MEKKETRLYTVVYSSTDTKSCSLDFSTPLHLTLYKTDISLSRTLSAGPEGVRLRESFILYTKILQ